MGEEMNKLKERVLSEIRSGKARMEPWWHDMLRGFLYASGAVVLFTGGVFVVSFVHFVLVRNGILAAGGFGMRAFFPVLFALPWMMLLSLVIFVGALFLLVRRYAFVYRHPFVYGVAGVAGLALVGGFVFAQLGVHERIERAMRMGQLPFGGGLYRGYDAFPMQSLYPGIVASAVGADSFVMQTPRQEVLTVLYDVARSATGTAADFEEGDAIMVFGERLSTTTIQATDVRRVDDERFLLHMQRGRRGVLPRMMD